MISRSTPETFSFLPASHATFRHLSIPEEPFSSYRGRSYICVLVMVDSDRDLPPSQWPVGGDWSAVDLCKTHSDTYTEVSLSEQQALVFHTMRYTRGDLAAGPETSRHRRAGGGSVARLPLFLAHSAGRYPCRRRPP